MSTSSSLPPPRANRYAMVRTAGITLALPVNEVGQALPLNGPAAHLPRSERALVGVFQHRGQVVPIVDLACWGSLLHADETATPAQVMILQKSGRMTGIAIERTVGIVLVEPGAVHQIHHDSAAQELFHSVLHVKGFEHPVPLLDTEHLLQLTQVWVQEQLAMRQALETSSASDSPPAQQGSIDDARPAPTEAHVVVGLGGLRFAVPVQSVGTLMPTPPLQKLPSLVKGLQGVFAWGQRKVPVVGIHHELGLQLPSPDTPLQPWLLVLRTPIEALGILVDEFVAVQRFESNRLQPAVTPLGSSVVSDPGDPAGRPIQLLSVTALFSALPMGAIGSEEMQTLGQSGSSLGKGLDGRSGDEANVSPEAHLVFQAGRAMATPLKGIQEIVKAEADEGEAALPLATHYQWRGTLVPLLDLRLATDGVHCITGPERRLLIVKEANRLTALVVEAVIDLVPAFVGSIVSLHLNKGRSLNVLTTEVAGKQGSYEIVDIGRQAEAFQDHGLHAQDSTPSPPNSGSGATSATTPSSRSKPCLADNDVLPS
ncbi:chemotaxis protein CheW [Acidovorax sp. A1169]|uniref:chemotaxis protein CheW n=1 Tax=Acidovorax sp. A1169 TaxID=3059524 RepID=UPI0027378CAB|nr:chemotaxis protein CheW [Acidovorax sp. A1169]MDP4074604.1 chemotaxis protein CheW [Acidovorax sp. A1169]